MSLSSLIVQREVATMRQVEEALARQVIYGGDLATNLLEVARVDEAVLTKLLADSVGLPPAPAGELNVADERVRAFVPPEMAAQRSIVPVKLEGEKLVLAVAEPMPRELSDQLSFALGMTIEQRVAPAVRVRQAIAQAYGVPLERRMQRLLARLSGQAPQDGSTPPPLETAPAVVEPPRPPSTPPAARSASSRKLPASPLLEHHDTLPFQTVPTSPALVAPPPAAEAPDSSPSPVSSVTGPPGRRTGLLQREIPPSVRSARRRRGPITFDAAKHEAEEATDRDALLDLFFDFARQFFDYAALFLVHGDIAEGRDAFGAGASRAKVVGIGVPLDLPGLMTLVRDARVPQVTRVQGGGLDAELLADLERPLGVEIALVPIVVRTRTVAVLVADCAEHGIDRTGAQQVIGFAVVIGKAFERLIVRRKLDGFIAGSRSGPASRSDLSFAPTQRLSIVPRSSAPPPAANLAAVRAIGGPPIPREEPPDSVPSLESGMLEEGGPEQERAAPDSVPTGDAAGSAPQIEITIDEPEIPEESGRTLFDELGLDGGADDEEPGTPPSAAIAVPPHRPPVAHSEPPAEASVIVDIDQELASIVDRIESGTADEQAEGELLRQGERAMRVIMARFPGPVTIERSRIAFTSPPPRASECGPLLRLVVRERRVALPFVLERLNDRDTETRGWATHVLCELPYLEAVGPLLVRLRDVDLSARVSAAHALATIARSYPEEVRAALLGIMKSADPIDRAAGLRAMAELREPSLVPELVRALGDGDEGVVTAAHAALVQVTRQDFGLDARPWLRWWELHSSRHRIEWLIDALTHEVSEIRRTAGEELRTASKEYFGYASDLPSRDRERAQQRYRDWWITEGRARFRHRP
jgi:hypothetical protein